MNLAENHKTVPLPFKGSGSPFSAEDEEDDEEEEEEDEEEEALLEKIIGIAHEFTSSSRFLFFTLAAVKQN